MKRASKRFLSIVCAAVMPLVCLAGLSFPIGAQDGTADFLNKWTIFSSEAGLTMNFRSGTHFEKSFSGFNLQIPDTYELDDLALYIRMTLDAPAAAALGKEGQIELAQAKADVAERNWRIASAGWKAGENEVLLNLSESLNYDGGSAKFDLHQPINFFRMYADPGYATFTTASTSVLYEVALVDISAAGVMFGGDDTYLQLSAPLSATPNTIEASVKVGNTGVTSWSIGYPNGGRYNGYTGDSVYDAEGNPGAHYMEDIGVGTAGAGEDIPEGTPYYAVIVNKGGQMAMANQYFNVSIPRTYEKKDIALAFWMYTSTGEIPAGHLELTSSGTFDKDELEYVYGNYVKNPKAGWNYVELPLSTPSFSTGNFDLYGANFIRWVQTSGSMKAVTEIRVSEMKFVVVQQETPAEAPPISDGDMVIFGNTNTADRIPISLFLDMYGNVGWVWGGTRYETQVNAATGEWVDLALVRDAAAGKFILYVDGVQAYETSAQGAADIRPAVAHTIGTDGTGVIFKGMIADLRAWSDVRTAREIADGRVSKIGTKESGLKAGEEGLIDAWFLAGNLNYVLGGSVIRSVNGNDLRFKGSRADDWEAYEIPTDVIGDDYYTMVFIPDTQELCTGAYTDEWMAAARWIADNVEKEHIVHVIGAGDTTWTDSAAQWQTIKNGYDLFTGMVSWSNMSGNHDYPGSCLSVDDPTYTIRDSSNYNKYFGQSYVRSTAAKKTYVGSFQDEYDIYGTAADENGKYSGMENSYYRFRVNNVNWMILQLEYHPRVSVIRWACDILEQYPEDNVILTTHAYIGGDDAKYSGHWMPYTKSDADIGGYIGELMPEGAAAWPGGSEQPVWTEIIYAHDNVKLLLCGHDATSDGHVLTRFDQNAAGSTVPQVMINAQDFDISYFDNQPLSMLGILRFSADGTRCEIQYYSPYHDASFHPSHQEMRSLTLTVKTSELAYELGDADGDGDITSTDARLTLQLAVDKIKKTDIQKPEAVDVDGDGSVTSTDARLILQYAVNKITEWP